MKPQMTLAIVLLLLTAVAATVGGLVPKEPFDNCDKEDFEAHKSEVMGDDDETPLGDESGEPVPQMPPAETFQSPLTTVKDDTEKVVTGVVDEVKEVGKKLEGAVEAFTGPMYAGF
tara:strand:+ start:817 stop:1164 length:348 start_codon:yes stop_codon:yes gene_type:complete